MWLFQESSSESSSIMLTHDSKYSQKKKSREVKSDERIAHSIGPRLPI
jgi:hypothetical protein